jgi:hypothetical protein
MGAAAIRVRDYDQLCQAIAARRRSLGLTQLEVDDLSGCQSGYQGKIEAQVRRFGSLSLPMILAALGLDLYVALRNPCEDLSGAMPRVGSAGRIGAPRPQSQEI